MLTDYASHSDINRVYGPLPLVNKIVGHEGVGRVVQRMDFLCFDAGNSTKSMLITCSWTWC